MTDDPRDIDTPELRAIRILVILSGYGNKDRVEVVLRPRDFDQLPIMMGSSPEEIDGGLLHAQLMGWIEKRQGDVGEQEVSITRSGRAFLENLLDSGTPPS